MTYKKKTIALVLSVLSMSVLANDRNDYDDEHENEGAEYMVGLMVATDNSIYVGGEDKSDIRPYFKADWGRYYIEGPSLGVRLFDDNDMEFSLALEFDGLGDDNRDDSVQLKDMKKFDSVIMTTLNYSYETELGEFGVGLSADVSSTHDGYKAELSYGYPFMLGDWRISPEINIVWQSKEVNQYYYGVSDRDVTDIRPLYTADSGVNYEVGIRAMYPFKKRHAVMISASYESYADEITNSPIVDEDTSTSIGIGYMYRF